MEWTKESNLLAPCEVCARITQNLLSMVLFTPFALLLEIARVGPFDEMRYLQLLKVVCFGIGREREMTFTNLFFTQVIIQDHWS